MELPRFDRHLSDAERPLSRIGEGAIGGKAAGLVRAADVLTARCAPGADLRVEIPGFTAYTKPQPTEDLDAEDDESAAPPPPKPPVFGSRTKRYRRAL